MAKTLNEQLDSVQEAIEVIETTGQSYTIQTAGGSRTMTSADLSTLYQREEKLKSDIAKEKRGGVSIGYVSRR